MQAIGETTPLTEIVAYLKEPADTNGLRGVTSDTSNRKVSPTDGHNTVLNISTGTGVDSGTDKVSGNETGDDEIIARVTKLVNAYDHKNSNSK